MIRIATLCQTHFPLSQQQALHSRNTPAPLDILCCRIRHEEDQDGQHSVRNLAASLQMACSSTLIAGPDSNRPSQQGRQGRSVLSILTGKGVWVLNSGSITVDVAVELGPQTKERVQFALVRKGAAAVLVLHLHHDGPRRERQALVRALFDHQLLKERQYRAVILCSRRHLRLSRTEAAQLMTGTGFMLHSNLKHELRGAGAMMLCVAREYGLAGVELDSRESALLLSAEGDAETGLPALVCAVQVQAASRKPGRKPHYPLSFAEQWAGYKEHFRPTAL
ncbi:MAG: hypothetical protein Q4G66_06835 [bacterium]|nr:hypothetical protein [bacterium]